MPTGETRRRRLELPTTSDEWELIDQAVAETDTVGNAVTQRGGCWPTGITSGLDEPS